MKILITGGAGFIGYNFCKYLLKNTNYKIFSIDNINDYYSQKLKRARFLTVQFILKVLQI